jgi:predicted membrane metal-binding protein
MNATHESFEAGDLPRPGSERSFGLVFAAVFTIVGLWPLLGSDAPRWWSCGVAIAFAAIALAYPRVLAPLNLIWFRFGMLLHRIVSPIVLGVLFFAAVMPTGLIMRLLGKDVLHLRRDPDAASYWIERDPHGPAPETMKNQF